MDSIRDMKEALSDFNSCQSTLGDSSSSGSDEISEDLKNKANTSESKKKRKRKGKKDYNRSEFLKKQDTKPSPK